jgi:hypothetical protein
VFVVEDSPTVSDLVQLTCALTGSSVPIGRANLSRFRPRALGIRHGHDNLGWKAVGRSECFALRVLVRQPPPHR